MRLCRCDCNMALVEPPEEWPLQQSTPRHGPSSDISAGHTVCVAISWIYMRASKGSRVSMASGGGPQRYVLGLALLVPLALVILAVAQLPGTSLAAPSGL